MNSCWEKFENIQNIQKQSKKSKNKIDSPIFHQLFFPI